MKTKSSIGGARCLSRSRRLRIEPLEDRNLLSVVPAGDFGPEVLASGAAVDWDTVLCDNQGELFGIGLRAGSRGLNPLYLGEMESGGVALVMDDMAYSPLEDCYYGVTSRAGASTSWLYRIDIDTSTAPLPEVDVTFIGYVWTYVDASYLPVFFNALEFSNDGSTLFAAGAYGTVTEHDCTFMLNTGTALATVHEELTVGAEFYHSAGDIEFDYNDNMYVTTRDTFATERGALLKISNPLGASAISRVGYTGVTDLYGLTFGPNSELKAYGNGETAGETPVYSIDLADATPTLLDWIDDVDGQLTGLQGAATTLGPFTDTVAPTATLNAPDLTVAGGWTYTATVVYSDDEAVVVSSLDSGDIWVTGPGGVPLPVTYASVDPDDNGTPRSASYEIAAPGGTWDMGDNGVYTVFMQSDEVVDIGGNHVAAGTLGTFAVRIVDSLGPITALERTGLDPSAGDLWYSCQASQVGILSIEAIAAAAGTLEIVLYDENFVELATSTVVNGNQRIDVDATAGETFYFKLRGTCSNADLHLVNLLQVSIGGGLVAVNGTDGPDLFQAMIGAGPGGTHIVLIDGMYYDSTAFPGVTNIRFNAGAGIDSVEVEGGGGAEWATFEKNYSQVSSDGIVLEAIFAEQVRFTAGPVGDAWASLHDSPGDDTFQAWPDHATMSDSTGSYLWEVFGVENMYGYATGGTDRAEFHGQAGTKDTFLGKSGFSQLTGAGFVHWGRRFEEVVATGQDARDVAKLYDSDGDDTFSAGPTSPGAHDAVLAGTTSSGRGFSNAADGFRYVHAYANYGGYDTADIYDSAATADTLVGTETYGRLYSADFYNRAVNFELTNAHATPGQNDLVKMYDSSGDDTLDAGADYFAMTYPGGAVVRANDFRYNHAFAYNGGVDTANLYDSPTTAERFVGRPTDGRMYNADFYNRAKAFEKVIATATPGQADVAQLYDSAGSDVFEAFPATAKMKYGGSADYFVQANSFRYVHGLAFAADTPGSVDRAYLYDSAGDDLLKAYPTETKLYNNAVGFYSRAKLFDEVYATGGGLTQDDFAYLYDSAGDDILEYGGSLAQVSSSDAIDYLNRATLFKHIRPRNGSGGTDTKIPNPMTAGYDLDDSAWT